ncbi:MAG: putative toxin-antitoxin system toxin component, PIN family [Phycisphaerae bacterium]
MKFVIDTNVLVSGILTPDGTCGNIIDLIIDGRIDIAVDGRIMDEYDTVLRGSLLHLLKERVGEVLDVIEVTADHIEPLALKVELPDLTDLPFLEVAVSAGAVLVTGNKRHFPAQQCRNVQVLTPREMLELLSQEP